MSVTLIPREALTIDRRLDNIRSLALSAAAARADFETENSGPGGEAELAALDRVFGAEEALALEVEELLRLGRGDALPDLTGAAV